MRSLNYAVAAAITVSMLSGCSGSSGSGSNLEDQITLPDDSDVPDNPVEEDESAGTDPSQAGFDGRRFWIQGDQDAGYPSPGLKSLPADANTSPPTDVDPAAMPGRQLFTIPEIRSVNGQDQLSPAGIFYRQEQQFNFAPVTDDPSRPVSSETNADQTCITEFAFDTDTPNNTAIAFNRERDTSTNECPFRFDAGIEWHQVLIGNDHTTAPQPFDANHVPVVALNAEASGGPEWLVLDRSDSSSPKLVRISSNDLTSKTPVDTQELAGTLDEVRRIAQLGTDSLLLAYGTPAEGDTSAEYRLAHYDRTNDTLTDLEAGAGLERDFLVRLPRSNWVATSGDKAYIGLGNALLEADASTYSILDSVTGAGSPFFVIASDTHVVWGARSRSDGSERRMVRLVKQGGDGGSALVNAPYMESRVRGTANGWIYFTVARGVQDNGLLDTGIAIGINPTKSSSNAFFIEDAQWIGSSVNPTTTGAPQDLANAPITDLFYRSGEDTMRVIKAVEDPANPLVQGENSIVLPAVTLGTLPERFSAVFMGEGFGPQRLLTAVSVDDGEDVGGDEEIGADELSVSNRVYHLNPENPDSLGQKISEEDGSLVRALPLF